MPRESAANGPRITTRVLRLRTRCNRPPATNKASGYEQGASVTGVRLRTRNRNRKPGPAARGPEADAEGGVSDRSSFRRLACALRAIRPTRAAHPQQPALPGMISLPFADCALFSEGQADLFAHIA